MKFKAYHEPLPAKAREAYRKIRQKHTRYSPAQTLEQRLNEKGLPDWKMSVIPRVLPKEYHATVERTCKLLAEVMLESAAQTPKELIMPGVNYGLVKGLDVFGANPRKITGSCRFDMAVSGPLTAENPPKMFEVNFVDYGMGSECNAVMEVFMETFKQYEEIAVSPNIMQDTANNMRQLGNRGLFLVSGSVRDYEYRLFARYMKEQGIRLSLMPDDSFVRRFRKRQVKMSTGGVEVKLNRKWAHFDFIHPRCFSFFKEIDDAVDVVGAMIASNVPMYDSFQALALENKCLQTVYLRNAGKLLSVRDYRFVRKAFANPSLATAEESRKAEANPGRKIIKFGDGHRGAAIAFGEGVKEVIKLLRKKRMSMRDWLLQDLILPNTMEVEDCEGPYRGFVDLSVYASYAFNPSKPAGQRLEHFSVSGYDCSARADGIDYFNYNSGVPVMVSR